MELNDLRLKLDNAFTSMKHYKWKFNDILEGYIIDECLKKYGEQLRVELSWEDCCDNEIKVIGYCTKEEIDFKEFEFYINQMTKELFGRPINLYFNVYIDTEELK